MNEEKCAGEIFLHKWLNLAAGSCHRGQETTKALLTKKKDFTEAKLKIRIRMTNLFRYCFLSLSLSLFTFFGESDDVDATITKFKID